MAGISIWQLLILLAIVVMLFGTKRLRGMGSDLGEAIKGFKKSVSDEEPEQSEDKKHLNRDDAEPAETESKTEDKTENR